MNQHIFSPISYGFAWVDGWYEWDSKAAHAEARKDRDEAAKQQRACGFKVKKFSLPNQLVSKGGIGTAYPHIEEVVTCYGFNVK